MASSCECAQKLAAELSPGVAGRDEHVSPYSRPTLDRRFPRTCRLTARRQFQTVYRDGCRVSSKSFTLFGLSNSLGYCRLGITATRKLGGAVRRNRIKRLMREVFRLNRTEVVGSVDIVVNARHGLHDTSLKELEQEFLSSSRRLVARCTT